MSSDAASPAIPGLCIPASQTTPSTGTSKICLPAVPFVSLTATSKSNTNKKRYICIYKQYEQPWRKERFCAASRLRVSVGDFLIYFFVVGASVQGRFGKRQPCPCRRHLPSSSAESFISTLICFKPTKFTSPPKILFKQNMLKKAKSLLNWGTASHLPGKALCFLSF